MATVKIGLNPKRFSERLKERVADVKIAETRFEKHASLLQNRENRKLHERTAANLQSFEDKLFLERLVRLDCLERLSVTLQQSLEALCEYLTKSFATNSGANSE